jgi:hypothetical protein
MIWQQGGSAEAAPDACPVYRYRAKEFDSRKFFNLAKVADEIATTVK